MGRDLVDWGQGKNAPDYVQLTFKFSLYLHSCVYKDRTKRELSFTGPLSQMPIMARAGQCQKQETRLHLDLPQE